MLDGVSHHLDGYDETLLSIGRCLAENREFQGGQKGKPRILGAVPLISFGFFWFPEISFGFPLVSFVWIGDADSWGLIFAQGIPLKMTKSPSGLGIPLCRGNSL